MLRVYKFQKGGVKSGSLNDLDSASKCWAECINPTKKELKHISEKAKIPLSELIKVLDEEERPKVSDLDNYSVIIVRAPWIEHNEILTTPVSIFISKNKNNIITITLKEVSSVKKIKQLIAANKIDIYDKSISFFTYKLLDEVLDAYFSILDTLEEKIDYIEDKVIEKPDKLTVQQIFSVKKTLIFFHRALTANREVISSIEKEYVANIDKKNIKRFRALNNDVTQLIDMEGTYRDILTGTLDIYLSSVSNNLGQVMKTLTVISAFVLIPTLISGIYGMNFNKNSPLNMPELYWQYGYFFALGLMMISVIITYIYFRKRGWL
jgi:magnesium transporter|tara:strand:- start:939 stop:1904 length:966 start_codon:yes stop_codon:yes gene_type:complete